MPRLFVGNFSFEQFRTPEITLPRTVARLEAELAGVWMGLAEAGDEILCPGRIDEAYWERLAALGCPPVRPLLPEELSTSRAEEIVPWGWTSSIRQLARRLDIQAAAPEQEIVWKCNSRELAFQLCQQLNCTLPGEALGRTLPAVLQLVEAARSWPAGWLLKANFGQSGRGQLRGQGGELTPAQRSWISRTLKQHGPLLIEPILHRHREYGFQWEAPPDRPPQLITVSELLTTAQGQYLGSRVAPLEIDPAVREQIISVQQKAIERLQALGYFGPVGIDAMIYRTPQGLSVRPIQDINARWTMGRLAHHWHLRLSCRQGAREGGTWWHTLPPPGSPAIELSPSLIEGDTVSHRTWWADEFTSHAAH